MTIERRMPLNHVLVPTDFSPGAALALQRAAALPLRPGATVSLLHVVSEVIPKRLLDPVLERARGLLQEAASDAQRAAAEHGSADVKIDHDVVVGTPFVEIIRYARSHHADLVVVGRHGARAVRDAFIGSTAERVIRKGDVSVLLVNERPIAPYERALVAIDLSDASSRVVDLALALLPPSKRTLRMVHAYHLAFEDLITGDALEQYRRELGEHATATAKSIAAPYDASGIECRVVVREGDPRTVILREAVRESCDLMVLGTHARSGVSHALLGSVAEWLVRAAPCDVAVTRPARFTFELPQARNRLALAPAYNLVVISAWTDAADDERNMDWARALWSAMRPFLANAVYVNYLSDQGVEAIGDAYPPAVRERLVALKNKYDPTNLFRMNHNIQPTA